MRLLLILVVPFIVILISWGVYHERVSMSQQTTYKGYESLKYTVQDKKDNIEFRSYEPALIAEVEVKGERDEAINEGFRILAGYIFGNNLTKEKISMTTPVRQINASEKIAMTTPVVQSGDLDRWNVQFMMPSKYTLATLPSAKDDRIKFRVAPAVTMVVIKFSGSITKSNLSQNLKKLEDFIEQNSLKVQRPPQYAFYDAPWTLPFMRRNEIAFIVSTK